MTNSTEEPKQAIVKKGDDFDSVSRVQQLFNDKYSTTLEHTDRFRTFDLKDKKAKYVVEVKKLNCNHNRYTKLIMGFNKYKKAQQYIQRGYSVYFVIEYLDGTYTHKYNNELYTPSKAGRSDRGYHELKDYIFIPRELILPF